MSTSSHLEPSQFPVEIFREITRHLPLSAKRTFLNLSRTSKVARGGTLPALFGKITLQSIENYPNTSYTVQDAINFFAAQSEGASLAVHVHTIHFKSNPDTALHIDRDIVALLSTLPKVTHIMFSDCDITNIMHSCSPDLWRLDEVKPRMTSIRRLTLLDPIIDLSSLLRLLHHLPGLLDLSMERDSRAGTVATIGPYYFECTEMDDSWFPICLSNLQTLYLMDTILAGCILEPNEVTNWQWTQGALQNQIIPRYIDMSRIWIRSSHLKELGMSVLDDEGLDLFESLTGNRGSSSLQRVKLCTHKAEIYPDSDFTLISCHNISWLDLMVNFEDRSIVLGALSKLPMTSITYLAFRIVLDDAMFIRSYTPGSQSPIWKVFEDTLAVGLATVVERLDGRVGPRVVIQITDRGRTPRSAMHKERWSNILAHVQMEVLLREEYAVFHAFRRWSWINTANLRQSDSVRPMSLMLKGYWSVE